MRILGCGGRKRRLGPLDLAILAAIHRPAAHPFLSGLRRRLEALQPAWPWSEPIEAVYHGGAPGADSDFGACAAQLGIPVERFPYKSELGKAGGPARNAEMLVGLRGEERLPPATGVLAYPGGSGTADMVRRAHGSGVPVLDLAEHASALEPYQRWQKEDAWLVRSDRRRCLEVQAGRPGVGPPIVSGHWLKVSGTVVLPAWALYVGRDAHGLRGHPRLHNPFPIKPAGGDSGEVIIHGPHGPERCSAERALGYFRQHLTIRCHKDPRTRVELEAIATQRRILVCWCGWSKPCHACIVAEFAVGYLAIAALTAACRAAQG